MVFPIQFIPADNYTNCVVQYKGLANIYDVYKSFSDLRLLLTTNPPRYVGHYTQLSTCVATDTYVRMYIYVYIYVYISVYVRTLSVCTEFVSQVKFYTDLNTDSTYVRTFLTASCLHWRTQSGCCTYLNCWLCPWKW